MKMSKRGQIAIFVIVAIILVVAIVIVFIVARGNKPIISTGQEETPARFVDSCVRESAEQVMREMMIQGGVIEPRDFVMYENSKITYLCKNVNYYEPCVNQYPLYITHLHDKLLNAVREDIQGCFNSLKAELEAKNYVVQMSTFSMSLELKPSVIEFDIPTRMKIEKNGVVQDINGFNTKVKSSLYDTGVVVNEILRQEAEYCNFENVGFSLLYPSFDIRRNGLSDGTKIYDIKYKLTGEEMILAVRGCVI